MGDLVLFVSPAQLDGHTLLGAVPTGSPPRHVSRSNVLGRCITERRSTRNEETIFDYDG